MANDAATIIDEAIHQEHFGAAQVGFQLIQPFFVLMEVTTPAEMKQVYEQMLHEMMAEDFCANYFLVTAWGTKPQGSRG